MLTDGQTKRSTRKREERLSGFSTQDQDSDVMCVSDTQWSGKPGKNVGQRTLGYFRLPWYSAKSNRARRRNEAAVGLKDVNACSEDPDKRALFTPSYVDQRVVECST